VSGIRGGVISVGGVVAVLAVLAAPAQATTDRADYAVQANTICKSSNAQQDQLYESFEQTVKRLNAKEQKARGKKRERIEKRLNVLFDQLPVQGLAIFSTEIGQLAQVAPAPGDEAVVADWIAGRRSLVDLIAQSNAIETRLEHLFDSNRIFHSLRGFRKLDRKERRLKRQAAALAPQIEALEKKDLELGTELGATYCVTGASGTV
jgi:hypothetical protein